MSLKSYIDSINSAKIDPILKSAAIESAKEVYADGYNEGVKEVIEYFENLTTGNRELSNLLMRHIVMVKEKFKRV